MATLKLGTETGSFVNHVMSSNNNLPIVGEGATRLSWTDRKAYEVLSVSKDNKSCTIQRYNPKRKDDNGMSEVQDYEYKELVGEPMNLRFRYGRWWIMGEYQNEPINIVFGIKNEYYDYSF